jgi:UDP-N-acetylmuramoyl-tripeptide--D-alanyl-D-alanine ligase
VGVITNIGPAHLQFFSSTDDIAAAKGELFDHIGSEGTAVLNADDRYFDVLRRRSSGRVLSFGLRTKADVTATEVRQEREALTFTVHAGGGSAGVRMPLVGTHNVQNALAAAAAALAVGVTIEAIRDGLENFSPVAMRSEVKTINGRTVLADYYNANPRSVEAALDMLIAVGRNGRTIAVLGDMLELGDAEAEAHRAVGATAARLGVDVLITYGVLAKLIAAGAVEAGMARENAAATGSYDEAARLLRERSRPGDTILVKGSRAMKMEKILEAF